MSDDKIDDLRAPALRNIGTPMADAMRQSDEIAKRMADSIAQKRKEDQVFLEETVRKIVREEIKPLQDALSEIRDLLQGKPQGQ